MMCLKLTTRKPQEGFYRGGLSCRTLVENSFLGKPSIGKFTKDCLIFSVDAIAIPIVHMHLWLSRHSGLLLEFKELQIQKVYLKFPSPLVSSSLKLGRAPLP